MAIFDRIATASDSTFSARVAMELMKLAVDVMNEDPTTANHANRLLLAQKHLRGMVNTKAVAAAMIANNATLQGEIDGAPSQVGSNVPDGDIEFVLSTLYNNIANAYAVTF